MPSVNVFDTVTISENVDVRPFRGRVVFRQFNTLFAHRPFKERGFSIYKQQTSDPDKVQDRNFRMMSGSFIVTKPGGQFSFGTDDIQKGAYCTKIAFPLLNVSIPFVDGEDGDWWIMVLPYGEDIETVRSTTSFECLMPLKLSSGDPPPEDGKLPNAPILIFAETRAAGILRLHFLYNRAGEQQTPSTFRVFHNDGTGNIDYADIKNSVAYVAGQSTYTIEFQFPHETTVTFAVRAETSAADRETNVETITGTADAKGPPDVENLQAFGFCTITS